MNDVIKSLESHRCIRAFTTEPVAEESLAAILSATQRAPTSINAQGVSVVVVREAVRRVRIAQLAGGQPWIAQAPVFLCFVMDFHKTQLACHKKGVEQAVHRSLEGMLAGATDVGIALGTAIAAAEALGFGVVPIGGIRNAPEEMIELLGLPPLTFPLVGLALGHPANSGQQKPRLPMASFRHDERYQAAPLPDLVDQYDAEMREWLKGVGMEREGDWSQKVASLYQHGYFPNVTRVAHDQGFTLED